MRRQIGNVNGLFSSRRLRESRVRMLAKHDQRFTQRHIGGGCTVHSDVLKAILVAQE